MQHNNNIIKTKSNKKTTFKPLIKQAVIYDEKSYNLASLFDIMQSLATTTDLNTQEQLSAKLHKAIISISEQNNTLYDLLHNDNGQLLDYKATFIVNRRGNKIIATYDKRGLKHD